MVCNVLTGGRIHTVTIDRSGSSEACITSSFAAGLMSLHLPIADFKNSKEFLLPQLTIFTPLTQSAPLKDTSSDPPLKMAISSISLPSIDCQRSRSVGERAGSLPVLFTFPGVASTLLGFLSGRPLIFAARSEDMIALVFGIPPSSPFSRLQKGERPQSPVLAFSSFVRPVLLISRGGALGSSTATCRTTCGRSSPKCPLWILLASLAGDVILTVLLPASSSSDRDKFPSFCMALVSPKESLDTSRRLSTSKSVRTSCSTIQAWRSVRVMSQSSHVLSNSLSSSLTVTPGLSLPNRSTTTFRRVPTLLVCFLVWFLYFESHEYARSDGQSTQ
ncbi:hypothetical protein FF38_01269 [Lucilia cuprina]|uniref:Uncharacterized protein n=1 Tax=Lucilia cuprina TaxID=7375 RepID=A0A0L0BVZ2_LUCCU|nr:hypothetical protein FF38_01269 [Lucilia cuprina]